MKSFVKVLISVLALGVMASAPLLRAQDDKAPPAEGGKKGGKGRGMAMTVERVEEVVGTLTADQKTKIADVIKKDAADIQAASREERMEKMQAMNKDIRALLTPDQQKKWDDRPMGGPGGKGGKKKQN